MKFGAEIQVSGNGRPVWLSNDDTTVSWNDFLTDNPSYGATTAGRLNWFGVNQIRLPEDHFAYAVIAAGFEPWAGGDSAPDDWDGGEVLLREGAKVRPSTASGNHLSWQHPFERVGVAELGGDIIGYKKRVDPVAAAEPTTQPDTDPTVALLTEIRDLLKHPVQVLDFGLKCDATPEQVARIIASGGRITRKPSTVELWNTCVGARKPDPEPEPLTITITGPHGSGKTRWAEVIRNLPAALLGFPVPVVVDGEVAS